MQFSQIVKTFNSCPLIATSYPSSETQGFNGEGGGKKNGSEKN